MSPAHVQVILFLVSVAALVFAVLLVCAWPMIRFAWNWRFRSLFFDTIDSDGRRKQWRVVDL